MQDWQNSYFGIKFKHEPNHSAFGRVAKNGSGASFASFHGSCGDASQRNSYSDGGQRGVSAGRGGEAVGRFGGVVVRECGVWTKGDRRCRGEADAGAFFLPKFLQFHD